jgi:phosphoenolpyruvate carboxylase
MIKLFGTLAVIALWLYTLKTIIDLNKTIAVKIAFVLGIVIFPFVGVFYPIYYFGKRELDKRQA